MLWFVVMWLLCLWLLTVYLSYCLHVHCCMYVAFAQEAGDVRGLIRSSVLVCSLMYFSCLSESIMYPQFSVFLNF